MQRRPLAEMTTRRSGSRRLPNGSQVASLFFIILSAIPPPPFSFYYLFIYLFLVYSIFSFHLFSCIFFLFSAITWPFTHPQQRLADASIAHFIWNSISSGDRSLTTRSIKVISPPSFLARRPFFFFGWKFVFVWQPTDNETQRENVEIFIS